jgi:4-methyl-5(b-hydroxyethyl)-thiazole monophosphate biosynthesis
MISPYTEDISMIYMFLAPGFEEVEALMPLDLLRRAGHSVTTVAIREASLNQKLTRFSRIGTTAANLWDEGREVTGSHGITVTADITESQFSRLLSESFSPEAVILPGGMPGTNHLDGSPAVDTALELASAKGAYLCAICAAPLVLGKRGYLAGKRATCFPGFESYLEGAAVGGMVIRDENIITAAGMGVAKEFGLEIISALVSPEKAGEINTAIQSL